MTMNLEDILEDTMNLTSSEREKIVQFAELLVVTLEHQNPPGSDWESLSLFALTEAVGIDLSSLAKEGPMLCALWVCVMRGIQMFLPQESLKYPKFENFLAAYPDDFKGEDDDELHKLWHNANWMYILFKFIPAKKNKGLVMLAVPRFVEGWHKKYVTGSGQTLKTANRVHVFEVEGETKANQRGKLKPKAPKKKKKTSLGGTKVASTHNSDSFPPVKRRRRISLDPSLAGIEHNTRSTSEDWDPSRHSLRLPSEYDRYYPVTRDLTKRRSARLQSDPVTKLEIPEMNRQDSDGNAEIKAAYLQFANDRGVSEVKLSRDESFSGLLLSNLSRSNSMLAWLDGGEKESELDLTFDFLSPNGLPFAIPEFGKPDDERYTPSFGSVAVTPGRPKSPQSVCGTQTMEDDKLHEIFGKLATGRIGANASESNPVSFCI